MCNWCLQLTGVNACFKCSNIGITTKLRCLMVTGVHTVFERCSACTATLRYEEQCCYLRHTWTVEARVDALLPYAPLVILPPHLSMCPGCVVIRGSSGTLHCTTLLVANNLLAVQLQHVHDAVPSDCADNVLSGILRSSAAVFLLKTQYKSWNQQAVQCIETTELDDHGNSSVCNNVTHFSSKATKAATSLMHMFTDGYARFVLPAKADPTSEAAAMPGHGLHDARLTILYQLHKILERFNETCACKTMAHCTDMRCALHKRARRQQQLRQL